MDPRVSGSTIARAPYAFVTKRGAPVLITPLDDSRAEALVAMYLAYEPRNAFWGLPPIRDDACRRWARGMIADGLNLVALSMDAGVVGHAALFPMQDDACEMLVVVSPPFQDRGIGTQLARCAVRLAHEVGFCRIWISVEAANRRARHVFRKCGFDDLAWHDEMEVEMALEVCHLHDPSKVRVAELMTRQVVCAHPSLPCRRAVDLFLSHPIGAMPVLDDRERIVGIISQTDLLMPGGLSKAVGDLMTRQVVTARADWSLARVISLFHSRRIRCVPVVDAQGRLVGVIGRKDILAFYVG
ncbi:MAG: GNAT family N-acetyltransferase [Phycisphaerae bacterium]